MELFKIAVRNDQIFFTHRNTTLKLVKLYLLFILCKNTPKWKNAVTKESTATYFRWRERGNKDVKKVAFHPSIGDHLSFLIVQSKDRLRAVEGEKVVRNLWERGKEIESNKSSGAAGREWRGGGSRVTDYTYTLPVPECPGESISKRVASWCASHDAGKVSLKSK